MSIINFKNELVENNQINPTQEQRNFRKSLNNEKKSDSFTNLYESIQNYMDENPQLLNIKKNSLPIKELDNSNEDLLFNLYYLFLSIFFLFLLFKIMNKK